LFIYNNICRLADAFIQSDLQSCVHTFYVWVVPGIEPTTLALQAHVLEVNLSIIQFKIFKEQMVWGSNCYIANRLEHF
jgi:hypothetical protein